MELPNYIGFRLVETMNGPDKDGHVSLSIKAVPVDISRLAFCRECKHYRPGKHFPYMCFCFRDGIGGRNTAPDDFCSAGERMRLVTLDK